MILQQNKLYISTSPGRGRGVFAAEDITAGELLEICPLIVLSPQDTARLQGTALYDYYFLWDTTHQQGAIALGWGSMFNHSYHPNVEYLMDFDEQTIAFYALRPIAQGAELFINYNGEPTDLTPLWFETS